MLGGVIGLEINKKLYRFSCFDDSKVIHLQLFKVY